MSGLRPLAGAFVATAPAGARVRTRLRVSGQDEAVLRAAGTHLGSLAGRDLAARCAEGRLDAKGQAVSRAARKRALTAESSSRWAGAITRTSEDQVRLAGQNLRAGKASLQVRIRRIEARLPVPAGGKAGQVRAYATPAGRHAKTVRLHALKARLARVDRQLEAGAVSVVRGGKALLRKRSNLAAAGLTEERWRAEWESARLFLTADGEKDKAWGNETIRWHPGEGWLEVKLAAPLAHLANRPHGRYRLSCPVAFPYRGDEVAAQAASGAVRYDISHDPARRRWHIDASWKAAPAPGPSLEDLRRHPVLAVDLNHGHLAAQTVTRDGNPVDQRPVYPQQESGIARRVRAAGNRVGAADMITDAPHPGCGPHGRGPLAENDRGEVRHGGGEPADGIAAPATVLIDVGHRQRMQRLHQQGPQAGHRRGQVSAHPPGDAGGPEKTVVPGAFRHQRHTQPPRAR